STPLMSKHCLAKPSQTSDARSAGSVSAPALAELPFGSGTLNQVEPPKDQSIETIAPPLHSAGSAKVSPGESTSSDRLDCLSCCITDGSAAGRLPDALVYGTSNVMAWVNAS